MKHCLRIYRVLLLVSCCLAQEGLAEDSSGLKISAAVDMLGSFKAEKASSAFDRVEVREAEILFLAPIDQTFDGQFSLAAHREDGESITGCP